MIRNFFPVPIISTSEQLHTIFLFQHRIKVAVVKMFPAVKKRLSKVEVQF